MTNFVIGTVVGFLICVWAIGTTPNTAFSALWDKLERVQQMSASASQAYDAINPPQKTRTLEPIRIPVPQRTDEAVYR